MENNQQLIEKDGFLFMGKGRVVSKGAIKVKSWKQRWFVLRGGSLYYYNKKTSVAPAGVLELPSLEIIPDTEKTDRAFVLGLYDRKKERQYLLSASSGEERGEWVAVLKAGKSKAVLPPPVNPVATGKKGLKYSLESTMASSAIGLKITKEAIPETAWQVLNCACLFLGQVKGEDTARTFKKYFLKIGVKLAVLNYNKIVPDEAILRWKRFFMRLASITVDFYQMPSVFDSAIVLKIVTDFKKDIDENLAPKLSTRSVAKLDYLYSIGLDEALITEFFQKKKWKELETMATLIRSNVSILRHDI